MYMDSITGIDNSLKIEEKVTTLKNDIRKIMNNKNASSSDLKQT